MERQYLRPNKRYPIPLNEDFWINVISPNNIGRNAAVAHEIDQMYASNTATEVERVLRENKENIDKAIMKQIAPSAVNVMGIQYENLISLSFDHDELIRQEENRRRRMREKIINAVLRKELMNAQPGVLFGHQHEPERLASAISHIENKALDVKTNIEQLLFMLDLQEEVEWPDMLDKFSSLASAMTQLQFILKKSALPSGFEDFGFFLRTHVLVPHCLSNDIDANLQQATSNRIHCWNHDAAPDYLRTKLTPEVEADESHIDNEKNTRTFDQVNKQILAMNKHIETLLLSMAENARNQAEIQQDIPTYSSQDTQKLVRAVVNGEGVRPSKTLIPAESGFTGNSVSGSHVIRPPGTTASPQQRR